MNNKKKLIDTFSEFNISEELKDPEIAKGYLEEALREYLQDGNNETFLQYLKPLVKAQGPVSAFAEKAGINRTYFYKLFNCKVSPEFATILKIIDNLGFNLSFSLKRKRFAH
jgi:probable addiction module antidote protein